MPTPKQTTKPEVIYIAAADGLMDEAQIRANLTGQAANPVALAVLAYLDTAAAEAATVMAHPNAANRDHAAGQFYALAALALDLRNLLDMSVRPA